MSAAPKKFYETVHNYVTITANCCSCSYSIVDGTAGAFAWVTTFGFRSPDCVGQLERHEAGGAR